MYFVRKFRNYVGLGDLIIVTEGTKRFRAVGEVIGPYKFVKDETGGFRHRHAVRWHWHHSKGLPISQVHVGELARMYLYEIPPEKVRFDSLRRYTKEAERCPPHVLVIDEINRANVSKVMGELVTLLEEDKREGQPNEVAVTLPHSRKRFTLPANLHIVGTMNTADRSIALLDTALRRRFEFEELSPDPSLLKDAAEATGIDLPRVLRAMNERLEWFIDRDHLIGHAWLMGARTRAQVDRAMRNKVIPLIAEYFHDDWRKVRSVLGGTGDFVEGKELGMPPGLTDDGASDVRHRWTVRDSFAKKAYDNLIAGLTTSSGTEAT